MVAKLYIAKTNRGYFYTVATGVRLKLEIMQDLGEKVLFQLNNKNSDRTRELKYKHFLISKKQLDSLPSHGPIEVDRLTEEEANLLLNNKEGSKVL